MGTFGKRYFCLFEVEIGESIFGIALEVENIEEVLQSDEFSNFQNIKITSGEGINLDSGAKREWKNIMLPKDNIPIIEKIPIDIHADGT